MAGRSFAEIFEFHTDLEEVLALHQEALLVLDLESARALLGGYRRLLALHMRHEEERLLPVFGRLGPVEKWPVVLYTGQHEKMRSLLDRVETQLGVLLADPPSNLRRAVIRLLELETTYKHLTEHHDGAEREGLVPHADRAASDEERAEMLESFREQWREARAREATLVDRARRALGYDSKAPAGAA